MWYRFRREKTGEGMKEKEKEKGGNEVMNWNLYFQPASVDLEQATWLQQVSSSQDSGIRAGFHSNTDTLANCISIALIITFI